MLVVEELYKEAVVGTDRNLIIFNRELDRIISGCISFLKLEVLFSFVSCEVRYIRMHVKVLN
jgi:hypothetical protein